MNPVISEMCSKRPLRLGYWWSSKKSLKFKDTEFADVCRARGIDLAKLDFERPLESQGPFDAIVHKLTNCMLQAKAGDPQAKDICDRFKEYIGNHPDIMVIDPLDRVDILLDRYSQYQTVQHNELGFREEEGIFIPAFVELTSRDAEENLAKMRAGGLDFPIVCKPSVAHGTPVAHEMCLVFNEKGLHDVKPPCVVQKFINHNAVLHKIFIIGDRFFVKQRPSLKNFYDRDRETIFFNSHLVSKADSASELTELDEEGEEGGQWSACEEKLGRIASVLGRCLGLTLLGVDVIVDCTTGRHAIIDINPFPGYDEVDDFFQLLIDIIVRKVSRAPPCYPPTDAPQEDSGIETSDSCDEKKQKAPPCRPVRRQHSRNPHSCATGEIG